MIRLLVWTILVVLIAPAAMADPIKTPADAVRWVHKRLYPSQYVKAPEEPPPAPRPKRGFKKAPPPVAETPPPETAPRVTPAPPRAKVKAKPKPRAVPRQPRVRVVVTQRKPTAGECLQLSGGITALGLARVKRLAAGRCSSACIDQAKRDCGL